MSWMIHVYFCLTTLVYSSYDAGYKELGSILSELYGLDGSFECIIWPRRLLLVNYIV